MKKLSHLSILLTLVLSLALLLSACGAKAQPDQTNDESNPSQETMELQPYATKPITITVPWGAGGGNDLAVRALTENCATYFGQPATIVNEPGGPSTVAIFKDSAKADGYEFLMATMGCFTTSSHLDGVPYSFDDFDVVCSVSLQPNFLMVKADSQYQSIEDFKNATSPITFASTGATSSTHVLPQALFEEMGVEANGIAFDSGGEGEAAVLGGHCDIYVSAPADATKYSQSGDMIILGVFADERISTFPDVPTFKEMGYNLSLSVSNYILAPKGMDANQLAFARKAFEEMRQDEAFVNYATNANLPVLEFTPEEVYTYYQNEFDMTKELYTRLGIM